MPVLRALIDDEFPGCEFNIEGYPTEEFIDLVLANEPEQVTLVPDEPGQATSDHGWDFTGKGNFLASVVQNVQGRRDVGFRCFVIPDAGTEELDLARQTGADRIEFIQDLMVPV